jgi:ubiquitin-conjugating enzyme E2 Q
MVVSTRPESLADTSEYPSEHTFFAFSPDQNLPSRINKVVEGIPEQGSNLLCVMVQKILRDIIKALSPDRNAPVQQAPFKHPQNSDEDESEEDDDEEGYAYYDDDDFGLANAGPTSSLFSLDSLQRSVCFLSHLQALIRFQGLYRDRRDQT